MPPAEWPGSQSGRQAGAQSINLTHGCQHEHGRSLFAGVALVRACHRCHNRGCRDGDMQGRTMPRVLQQVMPHRHNSNQSGIVGVHPGSGCLACYTSVFGPSTRFEVSSAPLRNRCSSWPGYTPQHTDTQAHTKTNLVVVHIKGSMGCRTTVPNSTGSTQQVVAQCVLLGSCQQRVPTHNLIAPLVSLAAIAGPCLITATKKHSHATTNTAAITSNPRGLSPLAVRIQSPPLHVSVLLPAAQHVHIPATYFSLSTPCSSLARAGSS